MRSQKCREEVRQRCGRSALCSALVAGLCGGAASAPFICLLTFFTGLARALICAGALTRSSSSNTHRMGRTLRLLRPQKGSALLIHCLYGLLSALSCLALFKRSLYVSDASTGSKHLQEQYLYVTFAGVVNGFYYYFMNYVMDDPVLVFPLVQQQKFVRVKMSIIPTVKRALRDSFAPVFLAALLYYWHGSYVRSGALYMLKAEPKDEPLNGLFSVLSFSLLFDLWASSTLFLSTIYCSMLFFNIYLTENLKFPIEPEENVTTLSQELTGEIEILNKLASRDLSYLAYNDVERRRQIFSLSIPGGHPTNWTNISSESMKLITAYIKSIENISSDLKLVEEIKPPLMKRVILSPEPFRSPILRNLALSSPQNIQNQYNITNEQIKPFKNVIKDEFNNFKDNLCRKPGISFFFGDLTDIKIKHVAHRGQVVSKVCQGLSHLIVISLEEDQYGVVQESLSKIIVCLLELKLALDKLTKSGIINKKNLKQDSVAAQMLNELKSAVKRSIFKITISFKDYIYELDLDNDKKIMLQSFINLREG